MVPGFVFFLLGALVLSSVRFFRLRPVRLACPRIRTRLENLPLQGVMCFSAMCRGRFVLPPSGGVCVCVCKRLYLPFSVFSFLTFAGGQRGVAGALPNEAPWSPSGKRTCRLGGVRLGPWWQLAALRKRSWTLRGSWGLPPNQKLVFVFIALFVCVGFVAKKRKTSALN